MSGPLDPRRPWRGLRRAALFLLATLALIPIALVAQPLGRVPRRLAARAWIAAARRAVNARVRIQGVPFRACPTLFVANHVSYLDIVALGGVLDAQFIAKSEIRDWPGFGLIARLGGTYFVRRHWREALIQRNDLAARMRAGESFVLFAEGTSSDGIDVLPFKSALFSVAEPWVLDCPVAVQPVTLAYLRLADGTPVDAGNAELYAWFGEAAFAPHLWRAAQGPGIEIVVRFHEPVISWAVKSRKALARVAREEIREALLELRGGRALPELELEPVAHRDRVPA
jgi:1-acyl-sn-glycerol-3-phosphate acyltransferase